MGLAAAAEKDLLVSMRPLTVSLMAVMAVEAGALVEVAVEVVRGLTFALLGQAVVEAVELW